MWGTLEGVRKYHMGRLGWDEVGYHFVITNGNPGPSRDDGVDRRPKMAEDGRIWQGRPLDVRGAHVRGYNDGNVGIAMVGRPGRMTQAQLVAALRLTAGLCVQHDIPHSEVRGHYELDASKTCPGLDMNLARAALFALLDTDPGALLEGKPDEQ